MTAVVTPPPARSSKLVSGPAAPPWLQGMKTKGDGSSRSEPYFASFTMPTISTGPDVVFPSRMRKCCPSGFAAPKYFWVMDLLIMATFSVVDVEIAPADDCAADGFKVPIAHIIEGDHSVIARFWSVAIDLHFTGPTAVTDWRDGGDAGRIHTRNRAQLVQHLPINGGPPLPRVISIAKIDTVSRRRAK